MTSILQTPLAEWRPIPRRVQGWKGEGAVVVDREERTRNRAEGFIQRHGMGTYFYADGR